MGLTTKDYQRALDSQSACNASGLIHSLHETLDRIWKEAREKGEGTDWVNGHPIVRLYAEQLMWLARKTDYSEAYRACEQGAKDYVDSETTSTQTDR